MYVYVYEHVADDCFSVLNVYSGWWLVLFIVVGCCFHNSFVLLFVCYVVPYDRFHSEWEISEIRIISILSNQIVIQFMYLLLFICFIGNG